MKIVLIIIVIIVILYVLLVNKVHLQNRKLRKQNFHVLREKFPVEKITPNSFLNFYLQQDWEYVLFQMYIYGLISSKQRFDYMYEFKHIRSTNYIFISKVYDLKDIASIRFDIKKNKLALIQISLLGTSKKDIVDLEHNLYFKLSKAYDTIQTESNEQQFSFTEDGSSLLILDTERHKIIIKTNYNHTF